MSNTLLQIKLSNDFLNMLDSLNSLNSINFTRIIDDAVKINAQRTLQEFDNRVRNWVNPPHFKLHFKTDQKGKTEYWVTTDDLIFIFVDRGTKPHFIPALRGPSARNARYVHKMQWQSSGENDSEYLPMSENVFRYASWIEHPGSDPKYISNDIFNNSHKLLENDIYAQINLSFTK